LLLSAASENLLRRSGAKKGKTPDRCHTSIHLAATAQHGGVVATAKQSLEASVPSRPAQVGV